jgi:hypothetical protein
MRNPLKFMKFIVVILLGFIFMFAIGTAAIAGVFIIFSGQIKATSAQEFTPLDFLYDTNRFEARVGTDKNEGRYITYHYEFTE